MINRDKVGKNSSGGFFRSMMFGEGLCFDLPGNHRDVVYEGDCDDGCMYLAEQFGFGDELKELVKREHAKIDGATVEEKTAEPEVVNEKPEEEASKEKLLKDEVTGDASKSAL